MAQVKKILTKLKSWQDKFSGLDFIKQEFLVLASLRDEFLRPEVAKEKRAVKGSFTCEQKRAFGHCVTAARTWFILNSGPIEAQLMKVRKGSASHVYIVHNGRKIDITKPQLPMLPPFDYKTARQVSFEADARAGYVCRFSDGRIFRFTKYEAALLRAVGETL